MSSRNFERVDKIESAAWALLSYWDGLCPFDHDGFPELRKIVERTRKALTLPEHAA